jgi:hypothetical protein
MKTTIASRVAAANTIAVDLDLIFVVMGGFAPYSYFSAPLADKLLDIQGVYQLAMRKLNAGNTLRSQAKNAR